jgi:hypothetical protein
MADLFATPPRAVITRRRWGWDVRLDIYGGLIYQRGGHAWTRRGAEARGRRMLARHLRDRNPVEYVVGAADVARG